MLGRYGGGEDSSVITHFVSYNTSLMLVQVVFEHHNLTLPAKSSDRVKSADRRERNNTFLFLV